MIDHCEFGPDCLVAQENHNHKPERATHLVVVARTDVGTQNQTYRLCTECAKRYVGGSIEVNNGPQLITAMRLR